MFTEKSFKVLRDSVLIDMERDAESGFLASSEPMEVDMDINGDYLITYTKKGLEILRDYTPSSLRKKVTPLTQAIHKWVFNVTDTGTLSGYILAGQNSGKLGDRVPTTLFQFVDQPPSKILARFHDPVPADQFNPFENSLPLLHNSISEQISSDEYLKRLNNSMANGAKLYFYFTSHHIDKHYRTMANVQHLTSCMSKPPKVYGKLRREVALNEDGEYKNEAYIHPLEAYEESPNLRLCLVSLKHHSQWGEEYPFIGRAIVLFNNGKPYGAERWYGSEKVSLRAFYKLGFTECNIRGGIVRRLYDRAGRTILPYADVDNRWSFPSLALKQDAASFSHITGLQECPDDQFIVVANGHDSSLATFAGNWGGGEHLSISFASDQTQRAIINPEKVMEGYKDWRQYKAEGFAQSLNNYRESVTDAEFLNNPSERRRYVETHEDYFPESETAYCEQRDEYVLRDEASYNGNTGHWYYEHDQHDYWEFCAIDDEPYDRDSMQYLEYSDVFVADHNLEASAYWCPIVEEYVCLEDQIEDYHEHEGHVFCEDVDEWHDEYDCFRCAVSNKWYRDEDSLVRLPDSSGECIHEDLMSDWAEINGYYLTEDTDEWLYKDEIFICYYSDKVYASDERMTELPDGSGDYVHDDYFESWCLENNYVPVQDQDIPVYKPDAYQCAFTALYYEDQDELTELNGTYLHMESFVEWLNSNGYVKVEDIDEDDVPYLLIDSVHGYVVGGETFFYSEPQLDLEELATKVA